MIAENKLMMMIIIQFMSRPMTDKIKQTLICWWRFMFYRRHL